METTLFSRRRALTAVTSSVLSAGAITLLGGVRTAHADTAADSDIAILNVAVGLEHEGIGAYAIALKSGLLDEGTAKVAAKFQDDHKRHNDALIAAIRQLGGEPVTARTEAEYADALSESAQESDRRVGSGCAPRARGHQRLPRCNPVVLRFGALEGGRALGGR